jgi:hypothetical protein
MACGRMVLYRLDGRRHLHNPAYRFVLLAMSFDPGLIRNDQCAKQ